MGSLGLGKAGPVTSRFNPLARVRYGPDGKRCNGGVSRIARGERKSLMRIPYGRGTWELDGRVLLILAAVLSTSMGIVFYLARLSPDVPFLVPQSPADWILYPRPPRFGAENAFAAKTEFRKNFILQEEFATARVTLSAMKEARLWINGEEVSLGDEGTRRTWKRKKSVEVAKRLRRGDNQVEVAVTNFGGPPALWFVLETPHGIVASDSSWEASLAGATWKPAITADAPVRQENLFPRVSFLNPKHPDFQRQAPVSNGAPREQPGFETTFFSVRRRFPTILLCLVAGIAAIAGFGACRRFLGEDWSTRLAPWLALFAILAGWAALFAWNSQFLPRPVGFDFDGHVEYLDYLLENYRLPSANEGWQMYQPPAYYVSTALPLYLLNLNPSEGTGVHVARAVQQTFALTQIVIVFFGLRMMFPGRTGPRMIGLLFAGFLPPLVYLAHYVTNEVLAATLAAAAFLTTLRILRNSNPGWTLCVLLGVFLGLGMLAKVTVLLVAVVIFAVMAGRLLAEREFSPGAWARTVALPAAICLLLCGGHYGRLWIEFGSPFVGNWDPRLGFHWWQDPGYHSLAYYLRFGRALVMPIFSGMDSMGDAVYVTLWGDGMCASAMTPWFRVPWNHDLMAAGYLLALIPTTLIVLGIIAGTLRLIREPNAERFLILGTLYCTGFALLLATLRLPYYGQAKAFYLLSALFPLSVAGVWGFEILWSRSRSIALVACLLLVAWGVNVALTFRIDSRSAETYALVGNKLASSKDFPAAANAYRTALRIDRRSWDAEFGLASLNDSVGNGEEAERRFRRALELNPSFAEPHVAIGNIFLSRRNLHQAIIHFQKALERDPDHFNAFMAIGDIHLANKDYSSAQTAYREAIRIRPATGTPHQRLAIVFDRLGDSSRAIEQGQYAVELFPREPIVHWDQAQRLCRNREYSQAVSLLRAGMNGMKNPTLLAAELAWILATCPDDKVRDGAEALALVTEIQCRSDTEGTRAMDALAAARAETGEFEEAANIAERLAASLNAPTQDAERRAVEQRARLYRSGKPYREEPGPIEKDP